MDASRCRADLAPSSSKLIGVASSRGERPYQEDTFIVRSIDVPGRELRRNLRDAEHRDLPGSWRKTSSAPSDVPEEAPQQVLMAGVFDGVRHGSTRIY